MALTELRFVSLGDWKISINGKVAGKHQSLTLALICLLDKGFDRWETIYFLKERKSEMKEEANYSTT